LVPAELDMKHPGKNSQSNCSRLCQRLLYRRGSWAGFVVFIDRLSLFLVRASKLKEIATRINCEREITVLKPNDKIPCSSTNRRISRDVTFTSEPAGHADDNEK